jgi:hypothetical protein
LSEQEIEWILGHCEEKLREYYGRGLVRDYVYNVKPIKKNS